MHLVSLLFSSPVFSFLWWETCIGPAAERKKPRHRIGDHDDRSIATDLASYQLAVRGGGTSLQASTTQVFYVSDPHLTGCFLSDGIMVASLQFASAYSRQNVYGHGTWQVWCMRIPAPLVTTQLIAQYIDDEFVDSLRSFCIHTPLVSTKPCACMPRSKQVDQTRVKHDNVTY